MGLRLGPVLGSRFGPKSGVSHQRILLLTAEVLQADLRRSSMSMSVGLTHAFFPVRPNLLLVQSRSLYGFPVSTSFLDLVLGAMMKQVCRQTLKSLAECLFGVRLELLTLSTSACMDLFWLLAFGGISRLASC